MNTPYFVILEKKLKDNIFAFKNAINNYWPNSIVSYSVKTNSLPWILRYVKECGLMAETVSDEEFQLSKLCGFVPKQIIFNGPIKSEKVFDEALENDSILNMDSVRELSFLTKHKGCKYSNLGLRINVNPNIFDEEDISFSEEGFRFGFSDESGMLGVMIDAIKPYCTDKRFGLHFHCNSATRSVDVYKSIARYAEYIIKTYKLDPTYIDIGGGFFGGVGGKPQARDYISAIKDILSKTVDITKTKLIVEPGSAIISSAVDLHTSVIDVKDTAFASIVTTDGSRIHIDPLWKKSAYTYSIVKNTDTDVTKNTQVICGYTCMDYDRIMRLKNEKKLLTGDEIIYHRVGGYTMTFGGMFIRYLPEVYVEKDSDMIKVRSRISPEEYLKIQS